MRRSPPSGALSDPADRALRVFRTAERSAVEEFARNDPYVTNGLVSRSGMTYDPEAHARSEEVLWR
jgi:hypothetical protein